MWLGCGTVTGARPFYDLTNPVVYHRDEAIVAVVGADKKPTPTAPRRLSTRRSHPPSPPDLSNMPHHTIISFPFPTRPTDCSRHVPGAGLRDFESFAAALLSTMPLSSPDLLTNLTSPDPTDVDAHLSPAGHASPTLMEGGPATRPERGSRTRGAGAAVELGDGEGEGGEGEGGCKEAVEVVTRNSQKGESGMSGDGGRRDGADG